MAATILGCQCEECRARWIADLVEYATFLEETVLEIKRLLPPRRPRGDAIRAIRAIRAIKGLAVVAERRNLIGEIEAWSLEEGRRHAAEERAAGRLH